MIRKIFTMSLGLLLLAGSASWGAQPNFQQIRRDNTEMRKSVVWLMAGIWELSKGNNPKLRLQPVQKKKILPIFNGLVKTRILALTVERPGQTNNPGRANTTGGSDTNQGQRWSMDPNDPKLQERLKQMQDQTAYGNKQSGLIDGILSAKQVGFIDNLNFDAEKYGFLEFRNSSGGSQNGGSGQGQGQFQQPDLQAMAKIRGQMQAGRQNLVKLCQNVEKMLKS